MVHRSEWEMYFAGLNLKVVLFVQEESAQFTLRAQGSCMHTVVRTAAVDILLKNLSMRPKAFKTVQMCAMIHSPSS